jgi:hypothetical protein
MGGLVIVSAELIISWKEEGSSTKHSVAVPNMVLNEHRERTSERRFSAYCEEWNVLASADSPGEAVTNLLARLTSGLKIGNLES